MKKRPLLVDAILGLLLTLGVLVSYIVPLPFLESLELKGYDLRSKLRQSVDAGADIAIISIDDDSIARLGRWPWSRARIAEMIDLLAQAQPKVIGLNILFSEPEANQGLIELKALQGKYAELMAGKRIVEKAGVQFEQEFSSAAVRLDTDARLLQSIANAKNVVLPMFFNTDATLGAKPEPLPAAISSQSMTARGSRGAESQFVVEAAKAITPLPALAEVALGVGHVNVFNDLDGVVRRETPAVVYDGAQYPSYATELVLAYLGFKASDARVVPGQQIEVGKLRVPLDESQSMLVSFYGNYQTFRYFPFHDVLNGKVQPGIFKDKIVLIGPSATGIATLYVTPVAQNLPSVELVANSVENILRQKFLVRPAWAMKAEMGLIVLMGLFIMLGLPRLKAGMGAAVTFVLLAGVLAAGTMLFVKGEWLKVVYPAFLLAVGYTVLTTKRFIFTEKGKELVEASAIETNKMLGLSFQGQGMLDLAFDKFRLCPLDDQLKDLLYNLALDFERKRQYNKAVAVYEHVAKVDANYKDIKEKMNVLRQAAEGAVFGGIGGAAKEGTVMISAGKGEKPKLGRYEIEKELGRGAMGIVYLGKDPKINRKVAIKTMMLEGGGDEASLKEVKERFFREAESAGTLNHPNIVRIFDAGEESDISYIAMELLDGHDLVKYAQKDQLLPMETAMEYVALVADALDYAHAQGIVHRDIKPANVMLLKDGTVRVADFGIAR
ncbi:MAG: CHASE2 domain-containing protein, partial [Elusimicrobia bacterium]|nr:CHASE2 domain-containing protein [Elusimicrobiota bacterium]